MLKEWEKLREKGLNNNPPKLAERIWKGVPDKLRTVVRHCGPISFANQFWPTETFAFKKRLKTTYANFIQLFLVGKCVVWPNFVGE